jgi:hypothetical protein
MNAWNRRLAAYVCLPEAETSGWPHETRSTSALREGGL